MVELYKLGARGEIRYWRLEIDFYHEELIVTHGVHHGALQHKRVKVKTNQSGRTINEQLRLEYDSRVSKQRDLGYKDTEAEARKGRTNSLGLQRPMLAKPLKDCGDMDITTAWVQPKLDGHRCLVVNTGDGHIAYSRQGKVLGNLGHILEGMDLPIGVAVDGELYCHGASLQSIGSWIKKLQPETQNLNFWAYDIMLDECFDKRWQTLEALLANGHGGSYTIPCPTKHMSDIASLDGHFQDMRDRGFEGLIIRPLGFGYQAGKRHKSLIKMKAWIDHEYGVRDVEVTDDGWGVLVLNHDGQLFKATAPGSVEEKKDVAQNPGKYLNRMVTIQYANLTPDGIPFHPVASGWRETL